MTLSWTPVVIVDSTGSLLTLVLAVWCAVSARLWLREKADDIFRQYIFLLTLAFVFFALSRSVGHLLKQILLLHNHTDVWKMLAPFSGALNSATFIVIFAFGIYFRRFRKVHFEIEQYKNNLEDLVAERTARLEETNVALEDEVIERSKIEASLEEALQKTEEEVKERRHVELALRESQGYLQGILDNTTLPMCLKDRSGKYILMNVEFERLAQINQEDAVGKGDYEIFPRPIADLFREQDHQVIKCSCPLVFEETITLGNREYTFMSSKFPLRDNGVIYAIGTVCTDITKRKQAEDKLAAEQERLSVTLRSIGDGVITTDRDGSVVLLNKVAENLTGWRQNEAAGLSLEKVFHIISQKDRSRCENPVARVIECGRIINLEEHTLLITKEGHERNIADSGAPILNKDNEIIGIVIVFRDVTHELRIEQELLKTKKLESIGVLAGGIAHDFNNILVAILGNINLAVLDKDLNTKTRERLLKAEKATERAKGLTRQLLTFAKGGEPVKEVSSLAQVIEDSANFVLHGDTVACTFTIPQDLWLVDIDKGQVSQVIQNIILNASHAMPEGGTISVFCENVLVDSRTNLPLSADKKYVKVSVVDQGIGMPPHVIDKIFDPYFSTKNKGSGLGLAICHSIISRHQGHISVQSEPNVGTTFNIYLPASEQQQMIEPPVRDKNSTIEKMKILVMDDEAAVQDVVAGMLGILGHEVLMAKDGDEAIRIYREQHESSSAPDLVIMDLTIPGGKGGKDAVKEIKRLDPDAHVVVASGYSNDPVMANYRHYGFCAAIVKPFRLEDISHLFQQIFD